MSRSPRWIRPDEVTELQERALRLLGDKSKAQLGHVTVTMNAEGAVRVEDAIAGVLRFDAETSGISECFGSTALNALIYLRENMVLDDLASV